MKGILVNTKERTFKEVNIETWKDIAPVIGCNYFETVSLKRSYQDNEVLYVDEEGFLKPNVYFQLKDYPQPLAGNGLILGENIEGEMQDTTLTIEKVKEIISWIDIC